MGGGGGVRVGPGVGGDGGPGGCGQARSSTSSPFFSLFFFCFFSLPFPHRPGVTAGSPCPSALTGRAHWRLGGRERTPHTPLSLHPPNHPLIFFFSLFPFSSRNLFDFTPTQQVRLSAGFDVDVDARGRVTHTPFLCVRENCWSLLADDKGRVSVRYDL